MTSHDSTFVNTMVDCRAAREVLSRIGGKWTIIVINRLSQGSMRFNELKRDIGTISQKVLTDTLRELEKDGLVTRTVTPSIPPRVDYELTGLGYDLLGPINTLGAWAVNNREKVDAARAAWEAANSATARSA